MEKENYNGNWLTQVHLEQEAQLMLTKLRDAMLKMHQASASKLFLNFLPTGTLNKHHVVNKRNPMHSNLSGK